jgi:hypothetical protein
MKWLSEIGVSFPLLTAFACEQIIHGRRPARSSVITSQAANAYHFKTGQWK